MKTWLSLFDDFFSVRSVITLGAFLTIYWLVLNSKDIPPIMAHISDILLGFWFGAKIAKIQQGGTNA